LLQQPAMRCCCSLFARKGAAPLNAVLTASRHKFGGSCMTPFSHAANRRCVLAQSKRGKSNPIVGKVAQRTNCGATNTRPTKRCFMSNQRSHAPKRTPVISRPDTTAGTQTQSTEGGADGRLLVYGSRAVHRLGEPSSPIVGQRNCGSVVVRGGWRRTRKYRRSPSSTTNSRAGFGAYEVQRRDGGQAACSPLSVRPSCYAKGTAGEQTGERYFRGPFRSRSTSNR
jgi:hypothetical protein